MHINQINKHSNIIYIYIGLPWATIGCLPEKDSGLQTRVLGEHGKCSRSSASFSEGCVSLYVMVARPVSSKIDYCHFNNHGPLSNHSLSWLRVLPFRMGRHGDAQGEGHILADRSGSTSTHTERCFGRTWVIGKRGQRPVPGA